jgi:hypothetical protein
MSVSSTAEIEQDRRRKISIALKGKPKGPRKPRSKESYEKSGEIMHKHWESLSPEQKLLIGSKISKGLTGKVQSEAHRLANSEGHKGLKQSDESRRKKSEALKKAYAEGRKQPVRSSHRKGVKLTEEHKRLFDRSGKIPWNKGVKTGPQDRGVVLKRANSQRGKTQRVTEAVIAGRLRQSETKRGKKQSPDLIEKRAKGLRLAYSEGRHVVSPRAGYGKRFFYDSPYQGRICLRSSSELQRALELDSEQLVWFHEAQRFSMTFNGKLTTYTPDFWIVPGISRAEVVGDPLSLLESHPVRVEDIKGWWGPKHKTYQKIQAFIDQYPHVDFKIVVRQGLPEAKSWSY